MRLTVSVAAGVRLMIFAPTDAKLIVFCFCRYEIIGPSSRGMRLTVCVSTGRKLATVFFLHVWDQQSLLPQVWDSQSCSYRKETQSLFLQVWLPLVYLLPISVLRASYLACSSESSRERFWSWLSMETRSLRSRSRDTCSSKTEHCNTVEPLQNCRKNQAVRSLKRDG